MTKKKIAQIVILAFTVLSSVLMCLLVPDTIAVQWGFSGEVSNYMSKYPAGAFSVAVCLLLEFSWNTRHNQQSGTGSILMGVVSCLGIAMNIGFILLN